MFIAPDESFLIVSCWDRPENIGSRQGHLYISFRNNEGSWTEPVNMGSEINSHAYEFRPYVTPDGKYFFFTSNRDKLGNGNVYWVDARVIEGYKPLESY